METDGKIGILRWIWYHNKNASYEVNHYKIYGNRGHVFEIVFHKHTLVIYIFYPTKYWRH